MNEYIKITFKVDRNYIKVSQYEHIRSERAPGLNISSYKFIAYKFTPKDVRNDIKVSQYEFTWSKTVFIP